MHAEYAACLSSVHNEVLLTAPGISWSDIAGLATTKQVLQEAVVLPSIRPDIFTGLRAPSKGALEGATCACRRICVVVQISVPACAPPLQVRWLRCVEKGHDVLRIAHVEIKCWFLSGIVVSLWLQQ